MDFFQSALLYLGIAVLAVPIANRLGLGSVLGYLIAGILIGPVFGIVGQEATDLNHFAEFGVVMMLFIVGLELEPKVLWRMRDKLLGLGGGQVVLTGLVFFGICMGFGFDWRSGLAIGAVLALSSTAIVLQTLDEKNLMQTSGGQSSFAVLLFQDIAVIFMIALLPLLGSQNLAADHGHSSVSFFENFPIWVRFLATLGVIGLIIFGGVYLSRPLFHFVATARLREVYTAGALFMVVGIAALMNWVGLSPALGTFLAGVVLSGSEYRHELESNLNPFKGLLLGLFFITVGAGMDFSLFFAKPLIILGATLGIMVVKFAILFALSQFFTMTSKGRWLLAIGLAQVGEFAFVLLGIVRTNQVLSNNLTDELILVAALSMLLTPLLFILYEKIVLPFGNKEEAIPMPQDLERGTVIVAGFGRFGQVVSRLIQVCGYELVVLDSDPDVIERFRKLGIRAYFGDASRPELLEAAGIADAQMVIAALGDPAKQLEIVKHVKHAHPHVKIMARASDRGHAYALYDAGVDYCEREYFEGGVSLAKKCLVELGAHPFLARKRANAFRKHDATRFHDLAELWRKEGYSDCYVENLRIIFQEQEVLMNESLEAPSEKNRADWSPAE